MRGAVAAGNRHSAEAGAWALAHGGNAVDAVVAAALSAFVAEGPLTGPVGGGFLLLRDAGREPSLVDCFFAVPSSWQGPMDEVVIDFGDASTQVFHVGESSVAVPGLVAGLADAQRRHGRLAWPELFEPALELARAGVELTVSQRLLLEILVPVTCPAPSFGGAVVAGGLAELDSFEQPAGESLAAALTAALRAGYGGFARPASLTGTTHISVIDGAGNAAALSSTLGSGSGVFSHGFQLNNMLGELDVIGAVERSAGERLPSMMAPTIVLDADQPRLVVGSAGSVRLAGAILQTIHHVVAGGLGVGDAIDHPRLHVEDGVVQIEGGWPEETAKRLQQSGQPVNPWAGKNLYFGGVSAVERLSDGRLAAAGDPRRGGHGVVVP